MSVLIETATTVPLQEPGHQTTTEDPKSWVVAADVQNHLVLMAAFHKYHQFIDENGVTVDPNTRLPIVTTKQAEFLARAEERLKLWISKTINIRERPIGKLIPLEDEELPPLDVLLLLHSYMLDPHAFYHDCSARYPQLAAIGKYPLEQVVARIDKDTLSYVPLTSQVSHWEKTTGQPFTLEAPLSPLIHQLGNVGSFSVDLPNAVMRQARFLQDVAGMPGWNHFNATDVEDLKLKITSALNKYKLMLALNYEDIVPPFDVDLIFHTHQLSGSLFRTQTLKEVGYFPTHSGNVTKDVLDKLQKQAMDIPEIAELLEGGYTDDCLGRCTQGTA